jgi:hypothetical protein
MDRPNESKHKQLLDGLDEIRRKKADFLNIVDKIAEFIRNQRCPLCGILFDICINPLI